MQTQNTQKVKPRFKKPKIYQKPTNKCKNCSCKCISLCTAIIHNAAWNSSEKHWCYHHLLPVYNCTSKLCWCKI